MDIQTRNWVKTVKEKKPQFFYGVRVLEVGSACINGDTRDLFEDCEYIGLDVQPYEGVDVISIAHQYDEPDKSFDVVYSTNSLEHDMYWKMTLLKMVALTKDRALMFFFVPSMWFEHGCSRYLPEQSLTTKMGQEWADYYKNITAQDVANTLDLNNLFLEWEMGLYDNMSLGFWGIKR